MTRKDWLFTTCSLIVIIGICVACLLVEVLRVRCGLYIGLGVFFTIYWAYAIYIMTEPADDAGMQ